MDTHTKLPRTLHSPAFEKLSPWPVAAADSSTPGGEAAQLPASEAPPACNKSRHTQAQDAFGGGRIRDRLDVTRGMVGGLVGDNGYTPRDKKEMSPVWMCWNRKSQSPCCQEQGQEIWFQPQPGH